MTYPQRYDHQIATTKFKASVKRCFDHGDPGTGKTVSTIDAFTETAGAGRLLVLAPLSILQASWGNDIENFSSHSYAVAHGTPIKREKAFTSGASIVITNHDGVNWLAKHPKLLAGFTHCAIDEYTAFKNRTTQRGKALKLVVSKMEYLWMLSGSPDSNGLCDLWYPSLLLDGGERLGKNFWHFRTQVSAPTQVGPRLEHIQWTDKPGAELEVAAKLKDVVIRFKLEDCISMPEHVVSTVLLDMPKWVETAYQQFKEHAFLELGDANLTAIHAGAKTKKLLQILSGSVYDNEGNALRVHAERTELVLDLIEERTACVVAYNWKHEVAALTAEATKRGVTFGVINGDTPLARRTEIVAQFQAGLLRAVFAHPQSAGHGLTLTKGVATIWASPTYNAEHYVQFNRRIYRAGQNLRTETIRIAFKDSPEVGVYEKLDGKVDSMNTLLDLMVQFRSDPNDERYKLFDERINSALSSIA